MYKSISAKIWVKVVAFLLIGVFLFQQAAYARHYTPDESMKEFFKSDADQAAMYVAGTVLSIAIPGSGLLGPVSNSTLIISAGVNIGSQIAVACGADPKTTMIVGGAVGGLTTGFIGLHNAANTATQLAQQGIGTGTLTSAQTAYQLLVPTVVWTASSAAAAYAGEKNPLLGMAAGLGTGIVANVAAQGIAKSAGVDFTADGRVVVGGDKIEAARTAISNINAEFENRVAATLGGSPTDLTDWSSPATISDKLDGICSVVKDLSPQAMSDIKTASQIISATGGDIWRSNSGTPIAKIAVDPKLGGFWGATVEAFRTISPGEWTQLLVSAAIYEGIAGSGKDRNKAVLANAAASFGGGVMGGIVNQWDNFGKDWSGAVTEEGHSPWFNPEYNFVENVTRNALYAGVDYGAGLITIKGNINPLAANFITSSAKFLAGGLISTAIDKAFLTDEQLINKINQQNPAHVQYDVADFGELLGYNLKRGLVNAGLGTLSIQGPSEGINATSQAMGYINSMTRKFATGANYAFTFANAFSNSLDSVASYKLASSIGNSLFEQGRMFYGKQVFYEALRLQNNLGEAPGALKTADDLSEAQKAQLAEMGLSEQLYKSSGIQGLGSGEVVEARYKIMNEDRPLAEQSVRLLVTTDVARPYILTLPHRFANLATEHPQKTFKQFIDKEKDAVFSLITGDLSEFVKEGKDALISLNKTAEILSLPAEIQDRFENLDVQAGTGKDINKITLTQKNTYLYSIMPLDFLSGKPMFSFAYSYDNPDYFKDFPEKFEQISDASRFFARNRAEKRKGPQFDAAGIFDPRPSFAYRVMDGLNTGKIEGDIRLVRGTVYYYGPAGNLYLQETTQLLKTPTVAEGKERMMYGHDDRGLRSDYLRMVKVKAGDKSTIRQDVPDIKFDSTGLDKRAQELALAELAEKLLGPVLGLGPNFLFLSQTINAIVLYEQTFDSVKKSYLAGEGLASFESYEGGKFAYDFKGEQKQVAMLPLYTYKEAYRKDGSLWAREADIFRYVGLNIPIAGKLVYAGKDKPIQDDGRIRTMFGRELLLEGKDNYSAAYLYLSELNSTLGYDPFLSSGLETRGVSIQPIEEKVGKEITSKVTRSIITGLGQ